jgi:hypothetical protein
VCVEGREGGEEGKMVSREIVTVRDTCDLHNTCESHFVCVYLIGEVVVDNDVNSLDVNATAEEVGGHQDALVELLEGEEERECVCVCGEGSRKVS